ncbi:MAG: hypothetical protein M1817_005663 [Caeruleum heppii]|nr:MAG: hypothetical protein M1817_005663 [Caeruleum heppii]
MELAMASKLAELRPTSPHIQKYKDRASLAWACILDAFITNEASVECFRRRIFDRLLEPWPRQKPNAPIVSKWKSTFQLQLLLLVSPTFHDPLESEIYLRKVLYTLSIEPVPRYRFLLEWIVVRIVLGHPAHQQSMVDLIPAFDHSNPKYIVSLLKIALTQLPRAEEDYAFALMKKVVPLSASAKVVVRHEAHWSIPLIWRHATEKNWRSILDDAILRELHAYTVGIRKHSESAKTRPLQDFDPEESYTLTGVFQGEYLRLDPPEKEIVTRDDFLAVRQIDGHLTARRERRLPLGEPLRRAEVSISLDESSVNVESSEPQTRGAGPLQTKSNSWSASSLLTSLPSRADHPPPHPLIVIGSLLTDAHNLGGLSRVSEIFGVATLYVNSVSVLKTTAFTSVAVSSEHWLAIEELPIKEIPASLRERRKEGYVVIGLEQTDRSIVLGGGGERTRRERNGEEADHDEKKPWRFPRRTVLVLGNEREGIPAPLLADLDECVMVRQWGRTRSMNVQTAAAVALYEYTRQHG